MAVTYTSEPKYVIMSRLSGGSGNVFNGSQYKSDSFKCDKITPGRVGLYLDSNDRKNLSSACKITKLRITAQCRAYENAFWSVPHVVFRVQGFVQHEGGTENYFGGYNDFADKYCDSSSWSHSDISVDGSAPCSGSGMLLCFNLQFEGYGLGSHERNAYIKNIKIGYTRTRACYITFKGDGVTETKTMYDYGTVPAYGSTPSRSGYTFKGWSDGTTTYSGTLPTAYEQDVTYTAVWEKNKYTLTVNAGTGGTVTGGGTYEHGTSVTIKATPNNGYKFVKWSDGNTNATRTITVTGSAIYTAEFATKVTYTITYNVNAPENSSASGSVVSQTCEEGSSAVIKENAFKVSRTVMFIPNRYENEDIMLWESRNSYVTFIGWYTDPAGGTQVSGNYTPTGNVTLYAHWSDFPAITPVVFTKEGFTHDGWWTAASGGAKIMDATEQYVPTGKYLEVYAHWKLNEITDIYIGSSILDVYMGSSKLDVYQGTTKIYG